MSLSCPKASVVVCFYFHLDSGDFNFFLTSSLTHSSYLNLILRIHRIIGDYFVTDFKTYYTVAR